METSLDLMCGTKGVNETENIVRVGDERRGGNDLRHEKEDRNDKVGEPGKNKLQQNLEKFLRGGYRNS